MITNPRATVSPDRSYCELTRCHIAHPFLFPFAASAPVLSKTQARFSFFARCGGDGMHESILARH